MTEAETWNLGQVAQYLGITRKSADWQLRLWEIKAVGREPGRYGTNLYPADAVRHAHENRPGPGARTDLNRD